MLIISTGVLPVMFMAVALRSLYTDSRLQKNFNYRLTVTSSCK